MKIFRTHVSKNASGWVFWNIKSVAMYIRLETFQPSVSGFSALMKTDSVCLHVRQSRSSQDMCTDTYVPTILFEMISKFHVISTSLMNMVIINRKQLQAGAWRCVKEEALSKLTKTVEDYSNISLNEKCTKFQKRTL